MDAVVVGGGVIGCAVARELALSGLAVTLVERDGPGANASWAAAGMLSPLAEADRADPFLSLLLHSRSMYPELAAALRAETGLDVEYRDDGTLLVALTEGEDAELEERYRWQAEAGLAVTTFQCRSTTSAGYGSCRATMRSRASRTGCITGSASGVSE